MLAPTETTRRHHLDMGMQVVSAARDITPAQVSEMLAIRLHSMHESRCPVLAPRRGSELTVPLVQAGLLTGHAVEGWGRGWTRFDLTEKGERVLLHLSEIALIETRRMVSFEDVSDAY